MPVSSTAMSTTAVLPGHACGSHAQGHMSFPGKFNGVAAKVEKTAGAGAGRLSGGQDSPARNRGKTLCSPSPAQPGTGSPQFPRTTRQG